MHGLDWRNAKFLPQRFSLHSGMHKIERLSAAFRPKSQFSSDLTISRDNTIPFFAISKGPIEYIGKYNVRDDLETEMMSSRWKVFCFKNQIPLEKIKNLPRCPNCFVKLIMQGSDMD